MNFPIYIAKRYLFSKSGNNAINIITLIAAIGVVVGSMSLFIVLSGFSGLREFSLQFANVFDSDLKVLPASGKTITFTEGSAEKIKNVPGIAAYSKVIEERVFLQYKGRNHIAFIKGVDENYAQVNPVDSLLFLGEWFTPHKQQVVIGTGIAVKLSLGIWDYTDLLDLYVPKPGTGQILDPSRAFTKERAIASGMYQVNEELNDKYVFSDIGYARALLGLDSTKVSSVEIKTRPDQDEEALRSQLQKIFPEEIVIKNRIQQNDALYKMLNTENIAVYLIFTLVLIIALFNVIGSIIMMVLDKRKNIKTLYNLGATLKGIRRIFFWQGTLMTTLGGLLGILLGVIVVLLQLNFELVLITSTLPYPVKLNFINGAVVFVTITVLGVIASKIASSRIRAKLVA